MKDIVPRPSIHDGGDESPSIQPRFQKDNSESPDRKEEDHPELNSLPNKSGDSLTNEEEIERTSLRVCIRAIFIIMLAGLLFISLEKDKEFIKLSEQIDCSKFHDLKTKYPGQNAKMFKALKVSIEGVFNRNSRPAVFMFYSTDGKILQDLMSDVVSMTQECIRQPLQPINLTYADLNTEKFLNDYSKIIGEYRNQLEERNILVINNLDELSPKIVPSLHSFTDTYNPLVQKSIIFLSLRVPQKPINQADYIFNHLQHKWNELSSNIRNPLITRVLDQTFFLEPISY